jgi:hypothetical protein
MFLGRTLEPTFSFLALNPLLAICLVSLTSAMLAFPFLVLTAFV